MPFNELNAEETRVIINKGTERAGIGELTDCEQAGTYVCRQCNTALYQSSSKFHSGCGWPSFDDEISGAVTRRSHCDGHLGHVFEGEGFTAKNTRHCVNSISMKFVAEGEALPEVLEK